MIKNIIKRLRGDVNEESGLEEDNDVNRRSVLRATGAVGAATTGLTAGSASALAHDGERSVLSDDEERSELSGKELKKAVQDALKNKEVKKLVKENKEIGKPERKEANGYTIETEDELARVVKIPFDPVTTSDLEIEAYILWSDSDKVKTLASYPDQENNQIVNIIVSDDGEQKKLTRDLEDSGDQWED